MEMWKIQNKYKHLRSKKWCHTRWRHRQRCHKSFGEKGRRRCRWAVNEMCTLHPASACCATTHVIASEISVLLWTRLRKQSPAVLFLCKRKTPGENPDPSVRTSSGVHVWKNASWWPCDMLATFPGCTSPLTQSQFRSWMDGLKDS